MFQYDFLDVLQWLTSICITLILGDLEWFTVILGDLHWFKVILSDLEWF